MTQAIAQRPRDVAGTRLITHSAAERVRNVVSMTRRNLVHISREPMQLSDVTIQPVLFTVLFVYLFGGAIPIPGGGSYTDFILAGLLTLNLVTSTMGTAVGLATDLHEGIIERFRALPMWRPAVLVGRSLADLLTSCLCALVVAVTGLAVGWRTSAGPLSIIAGFALVLFFAYSLSWVAACVGLNSKSPESAASFGFIVLFPLAFVSNVLTPAGPWRRPSCAHRARRAGRGRGCGRSGLRPSAHWPHRCGPGPRPQTASAGTAIPARVRPCLHNTLIESIV